MFQTCPIDRPLIAQLSGRNVDEVVACARDLEATGCVDAVDLNLGCPQACAEKGGYGAFLLTEPELVYEIVSGMARALTIPVTCKIRVLSYPNTSPRPTSAVTISGPGSTTVSTADGTSAAICNSDSGGEGSGSSGSGGCSAGAGSGSGDDDDRSGGSGGCSVGCGGDVARTVAFAKRLVDCGASMVTVVSLGSHRSTSHATRRTPHAARRIHPAHPPAIHAPLITSTGESGT